MQERESGYYAHARPEVLALVPETAREVLDLGCGAGMLGATLKERQECRVTGIDWLCCGAEDRLDEFVLANLNDYDEYGDPRSGASPYLDRLSGPYDCIIAADVLEHLSDPQSTASMAWWLATEDATLVVSVPNARNWRIVNNLLRGDLPYADAGLLDTDHRWFFTRREVEKLLWRAGWSVELMRYVLDPGLKEMPASEWVAADHLHYRAESVEEAREFWAYQILMRCRRDNPDKHGLTTVIIPCWNQLAYTKLCLKSLRQSVREPVEVIVVDNGSDDGTYEWLQELSEDWEALRVLRQKENIGWIRAVNLGLREGRGQQFVCLNNDTVLPTGWLEPLLRALHSGEGWGIVGPLSNNVSGRQCIRVGYEQLENMDGWAWDFMRRHAGQILPSPRLVGFCLAISRECYEQIGPMDERFGMGLCDDDDWCLSAKAYGYMTGIVLGSFVHHWGSVTFKAQMPDWEERLRMNLQLLRAKWPGLVQTLEREEA